MKDSQVRPDRTFQWQQDLDFLEESLWIWEGQPDILERVGLWLSNTRRHMEEPE